MKIDDVRISVFRRPADDSAPETFIKGQSMQSLHTELVALRITDDEGHTGETLSLGGGLGMGHYLASTVKPFLIGRNPLEREALWQEMWDANRLWFSPLFMVGTADVALWDLYGKIRGAPIHEILGTYRTRIPAYASSMTHSTVEEFVEEALEFQGRGYHGYKLHVLGDPEFDIECCQAVRAAVGDWALMVDVVSGYDQRDALRVGQVLDELDYYWYEEPLRDYDLHGYRLLADKLKTPIAGTETNEGGLLARAEFAASRAVDIVRADPSFTYGIGQTRKIGALAEAFGLNCEIHTNPNPMMDAAALHVALSMRNTDFFEQLVPTRTFDFAVEQPVRIDSEGYAVAPDGPGLGVNIDWDYVERYTIAEL
ncbi:mandelate racemase [Amycolatopsis acidicola]|uniref:Mandelate racemase n=1 Tax=Amycolatopsis acidicola TaxID=2596893 RepID=A0A5N0UTN4_9PSEU|nr:enolase C-terminal domain-like protein [Amycolatopsis acidicola]KAA9153453.1 mandelate racemase [Amycolatopsis acidicola]